MCTECGYEVVHVYLFAPLTNTSSRQAANFVLTPPQDWACEHTWCLQNTCRATRGTPATYGVRWRARAPLFKACAFCILAVVLPKNFHFAAALMPSGLADGHSEPFQS